jgi:hypothetical protein
VRLVMQRSAGVENDESRSFNGRQQEIFYCRVCSIPGAIATSLRTATLSEKHHRCRQLDYLRRFVAARRRHLVHVHANHALLFELGGYRPGENSKSRLLPQNKRLDAMVYRPPEFIRISGACLARSTTTTSRDQRRPLRATPIPRIPMPHLRLAGLGVLADRIIPPRRTTSEVKV